eukprot:GEMP01060443.1.p1 GENE.GEMP01060443.1~~GEMP01060443.1.p1  ORF type:complete len:251 (+),score=44.97 GEMP01060443.1:265-1017(+)
MATSRLQMMAEECDASGFCDWDELTERYASLLERQRIAVEEFNRQIESLFLQEVSDNFQLELQEELVAAAGVTQDMDSLVRIPMIVLCRTLEDNERRHLQRHGKEKTSSWNALLVQLHGVLDPLFRDGLKTASKLALRHGRDARALFLEALNSRIQVLRSRCEETLEQKTKATMDFDSLKSRSKREFQEACRCAVYLSTAQISDDFVETQARQQVARSMIEFARWPLKQQEKQGLLDQLSQIRVFRCGHA